MRAPSRSGAGGARIGFAQWLRSEPGSDRPDDHFQRTKVDSQFASFFR